MLLPDTVPGRPFTCRVAALRPVGSCTVLTVLGEAVVVELLVVVAVKVTVPPASTGLGAPLMVTLKSTGATGRTVTTRLAWLEVPPVVFWMV